MSNFPEENKGESFVFQKIDRAYIVWIANGNQYLQLEEPAFFVFQNLEQGISQQQITTECTKRYHAPEKKCARFVSEIAKRIENVRKISVSASLCENQDKQEIPEQTFFPYSSHSYLINGKHIRFDFETRIHKYFLHPLLEHLETQAYSSNFILFELFDYGECIVLRVHNQIKGMWKQDETHLLKGMAFLQILNAVYEKDDKDWMAVIHASAVSNGSKTIIFTASSGSGKSTIAALLQKEGFALVSDDFVAIGSLSQHVFPFPVALSIKEGAMDILAGLYPSLKNLKMVEQSATRKRVRYLPVNENMITAPTHEILFVKYDPNVDFEMKELSRVDALKILLDETWTFPSAENATRFLKWYSQRSFFSLTYSNNEKALDAIKKLFEQ